MHCYDSHFKVSNQRLSEDSNLPRITWLVRGRVGIGDPGRLVPAGGRWAD